MTLDDLKNLIIAVIKASLYVFVALIIIFFSVR